jgi:DNA ligase-1
MILAPLYKRSSTGAIQEWTIRTDLYTITTCWGQVDGAVQTASDIILEGKNPGKANATTPVQQAELEAQARWTKQLQKGYVVSVEAAKAGAVDACIAGGVLPMLAHKYSEHPHRIVWPAAAQPKLDGHRCIATVVGGKATLWSRTRKPIHSMPHIVQALEALGVPDITLDGELYTHAYRANFEALTSFIRSATPKEGHEVVLYHVYDVVVPGPYNERQRTLSGLRLSAPLMPVETRLVLDAEALTAEFARCLADGYEGAMVRNLLGEYVGRRSYDLQKVKAFDSSEFYVVGVEEGRGKLAGHAILVCKVGDGTVGVKMSGDTARLKGYFEHPETCVGRQLEVQHQGLTADGKPRFPVGLRFRDV